MSDHHPPERRHTDPLLKELIRKVDGFSKELEPIREFMADVTASKRAAIWTVGVLAAIGAAIKWVWELRDHIHPNVR